MSHGGQIQCEHILNKPLSLAIFVSFATWSASKVPSAAGFLPLFARGFFVGFEDEAVAGFVVLAFLPGGRALFFGGALSVFCFGFAFGFGAL